MAWRSPLRLSRCRSVRPELAGRGAAPVRRARAASLCRRSGLSPAVASSCAATSGPDAEQGVESGCGGGHECSEPAGGLGAFGGEGCDALGQGAQGGGGGLGGVVEVVLVDGQVAAGGQQGGWGQAAELAPQGFRGGHDDGAELVERGGAGLDRAAAGHLQHADGFDRAGAEFGHGGGPSGQHRPGGCDRVDRVGLAQAATLGPVRGACQKDCVTVLTGLTS